MPQLSRLLNKVHRADAAHFIAELPDESIDFVMTSPPYWGLRDYGVEGQIGLEKHPRDYIAKLVAVFADLRQVLKPQGSLFLNLGDTYCSTKGAPAGQAARNSRHHEGALRKRLDRAPVGRHGPILRERDSRWLPKAGKNPGDFWSIATKPFPKAHFAVYPEALCDQPIRAACPARVCVLCGCPRVRITRRVGHTGRLRRDNARPRHGPGFRRRKKRSAWGEQPFYKTIGWTRCRCNKGFRPGIVFDPFAGAGTTLVVAKRLGRHYLGSDLNPDYVTLARQRQDATVIPASGS